MISWSRQKHPLFNSVLFSVVNSFHITLRPAVRCSNNFEAFWHCGIVSHLTDQTHSHVGHVFRQLDPEAFEVSKSWSSCADNLSTSESTATMKNMLHGTLSVDHSLPIQFGWRHAALRRHTQQNLTWKTLDNYIFQVAEMCVFLNLDLEIKSNQIEGHEIFTARAMVLPPELHIYAENILRRFCFPKGWSHLYKTTGGHKNEQKTNQWPVGSWKFVKTLWKDLIP